MDTKSADIEILTSAQSGSLAAFEILYRKYERPIYRTAVAILGDSQAAEEVLQDCFLRTYKHLHRLNGDPSISPWLHRVAVNLCYSRLRHNYLARLAVSLESLGTRLLASSCPSPEENSYQSEVQAAIQKGISALSLNHRAVIVLHYLQGFSLEEIAYILDCPLGTVKSRLYHARRVLGQQLASLQPQWAPELA
jgi:RNA polymerase sigma-70 factor (ECF subfamily)